MKKGIFCLALVIACLHLLAQSKPNTKSLLVKVNPLSLLDPLYPTLQMGVEGYSGRVGFSYSFGPAVNAFVRNKQDISSSLTSYSGTKHKLSGQYLVRQHFVGIEYFKTVFNKGRENGSYSAKSSSAHYSFDHIKQKVDVWGLSFKAGLTRKLNEKFLFLYSNSLGMRRQSMQFKDGTNLQQMPEGGEGRSRYFIEGSKLLPHFSIELAVGYKLF